MLKIHSAKKNKIGVEIKPCVTSQSKRRIRCYEDNNTKGWDTQETLGLLLDSITKTVLHTIAQVVILHIVANLCFEHFPVLSSIVWEQFWSWRVSSTLPLARPGSFRSRLFVLLVSSSAILSFIWIFNIHYADESIFKYSLCRRIKF